MARATDWLRARATVLIGLLLIGVTLWSRAGLLAHSFFRLDDFFILDRAASSGLNWHYLMWADEGHLMPLGFALAWIVVKISPVDWTLASAVTLVLLFGTCVALLRMLREFFGDHPGILIPLLLYLLSPLSFSGLSWWTVTLELLPLQLAIFCAVTAHLRYLRTGRFRYVMATAGWVFIGLASSLKGVAVPLLLFALTSAFLVEGRWSRAVLTSLRTYWRAWLIYGGLIIGYITIYVVQLSTSGVAPGRPGAFTSVFSFASTLIKYTFLPAAFGGPWRWLGVGAFAGVDPPADMARVTWLLAAGVLLVSIWYRPRAWRAWAILAGWLAVADILPVILGRVSFFPGVLLGLVARYVWDASGILAICLGLAFLSIRGEPTSESGRARFFPPLRTITISLITAVVIGSIWSFYTYPTDPSAAEGRSYVATARIALAEAPSAAVIVNDPIPLGVTGGVVVGSMDTTARLFSPLTGSRLDTPLRQGGLAMGPRFIAQLDGTYDHLLEFDGWGRLVPAVVSGSGNLPLAAGRSCLPHQDGTTIVRLRSAVTKASIVRLGYLAGSAGQVLVEFGGSAVVYSLQRGLHDAYVTVRGSGSIITVISINGRMPCIGDAEAGVLLPSGSAPAIPPLAVNG